MKHQRTFVISLVALLSIVVFTACVQASAEEPIETDIQQSGAVLIPLEENEARSGSEFFAANPELMAAGRFTALVIETDSEFFAANPELMVAGRFTAPVIENEKILGSEFFAANPELMTVRRYTATSIEK